MSKSKQQTHAETALRRHFEHYVPLSDTEFAQALGYFSFRQVPKDTVLVTPGDAVQHTYWVFKGLLASFFNDGEGKEHIMLFAIENCWITDQHGFYNQVPAIFRLEALEDTDLWSLSFENREKLCEAIPKLNHFFRKRANYSFVKQQRRLLTYMTADAQERFNLLMEEYPGLYQRVTKQVLAAYLGVARETLSRFKKK